MNTSSKPVASHKWDETFFARGVRPSVEDIESRITELEEAVAVATAQGSQPLRSWFAEIQWRKRQIGKLQEAS